MTKTGVPTIIGTRIPGVARFARIPNLSKQAKLRLSWIDYYQKHGCNGRLTCRHFGINHRSFYRYFNRYQRAGFYGLESRSCRPHRIRISTTPPEHISLICRLRKSNPEYSKYKLQVLLKRDYEVILSASTIGRIIKRYHLFCPTPIKSKGHPQRVLRRRKPNDLNPTIPGELIEFDVKHLPMIGKKRYGFVAIDIVSKQACVHVASTITSHQAVIAWGKACRELGYQPKAVLNDNGSENLGEFARILAEQKVDHYFAKPHTPKDKPYVERFIGSLERECIQWGGLAIDLSDQQEIIDRWLKKYHSYRPHQSLGYLTPDKYRAKLDADVALML